MKNAELIWHNGRLKPWHEATVHVSAHALHYGSSVFEGERVYATPNAGAALRAIPSDQRSRLVQMLCDIAEIAELLPPPAIDLTGEAGLLWLSAGGTRVLYSVDEADGGLVVQHVLAAPLPRTV